MKLILKLPNGKPPFIGIEFEKQWQGEKENKDLLLEHTNIVYSLLVEPAQSGINIRLICDSPLVIRFYHQVQYNIESFKRWHFHAQNYHSINFGHTYKDHSEDKICVLLQEGKRIPCVFKITHLMVDET